MLGLPLQISSLLSFPKTRSDPKSTTYLAPINLRERGKLRLAHRHVDHSGHKNNTSPDIKVESICTHTRYEMIQLHQSTFPYLSDTTAPFFVNGTVLPDIEFDIGESYSGTLPIDDT